MAESEFRRDIREMKEATLPKEEYPVIWGGAFLERFLGPFLNLWESEGHHLPWRLWEWASAIELQHGESGLPPDLAWLERSELFGRGGHLSLRRDGQRFLWHYVGPPAAELPAGLEVVHEEEPEGASPESQLPPQRLALQPGPEGLQRYERSILLWGTKAQDNQGHIIWLEDRMAGGKKPLVYPGVKVQARGRVCLKYHEYLRGDCLEAVWWLELAEWEEKDG